MDKHGDILSLSDKNVLCIVAHPDDESIFCASLLRTLANRGNRCWVQCVTTIADCNTIPDDPAAESLRQQKRAAAFVDSCRLMGAWPLPNLGLPNSKNIDDCMASGRAGNMYHRLASIFRALRFDLSISHGCNGESGHPQHVLVNRAVELICRDNGRPCLTFSPNGPISVPIDWDFKNRVLGCYKFGCTRTAEWAPNPLSNPELAPWLTDFERFDLWPAQPE